MTRNEPQYEVAIVFTQGNEDAPKLLGVMTERDVDRLMTDWQKKKERGVYEMVIKDSFARVGLTLTTVTNITAVAVAAKDSDK